MSAIPKPHTKVPMAFRAQVEGRCQLQRIAPGEDKQHIQRWTTEWTRQIERDCPQFADGVQSREYDISWRLVTDGGQDDTIIRPLIGERGWPLYAGSSCKGVFRGACSDAQAIRFCGGQTEAGYVPGCLRFHGGYPVNADWKEGLEDLVFPQQSHQLGMGDAQDKAGGAFAAISLYKPRMRFGISSQEELTTAEWQEVWEIWERAIASGIGGRTCAGYGRVRGAQSAKGRLLFRGILEGQGAASKLLDKTGEFRPNAIRAAVRGHALRIFGGLAGAEAAHQLVEELFGGIKGRATVGLLAMDFDDTVLEMDWFGAGPYEVPTYKVTGALCWRLVREIPEQERKGLQRLIVLLTRFSVLLGGFGKSWRRADHRLFFKDYYPNWSEGMGQDRKPLIGCQWEWADGRSLRGGALSLKGVGNFIDLLIKEARAWMQLKGVSVASPAKWREAWTPDKVQVWGRVARNPKQNPDGCLAAAWFHGPYRSPDRSIAKTSMTGKIGRGSLRVGRLWHRMYPMARPLAGASDPKKADFEKTNHYLELLTIFHDRSDVCQDFLSFLASQSDFEKLWS